MESVTIIKRPLCLLCLGFVVMVAIVMKLYPPPEFTLGEWEEKSIEIQGIVEQIQIKNDNLVITLSGVLLNKDSKKHTIICYMNQSYQPKIGSKVLINGKAQMFSKGTNPGEFNQLQYQKSNQINFKLVNGEIHQESKKYDVIKEWLYQLKKKMVEIIQQTFSEKNSSIMKAMLLGEKGDLDKDIKSLYQRNGIAHILAISGLHISIIGMGLYGIFRKIRVPIPIAIICSILTIYLYGVMIGMGSSAFRAIFMFSLHLFAILNKRTYDLLTAMAVGAVFLLLTNPYYIYHTGFLLSFGAIMGIGLLNPILIARYQCKNRIMAKVNQALYSSFSITLVTLPILLLSYYEFPVYGIFLNLCIIPLMTILVMNGILILILGVLFQWTNQIMGTPCSLILLLYEKLCVVFQYLPYSMWITGKPNEGQIIVFYGIILGIIWFDKKIKNAGIILGIGIAIFIVTFQGSHPFSITFLDVGQGDGIFIRSKDNITYLIDSGSTSKKNLATYQLLPFLKYNGVSKLDYVFVTHMDQDHISGVMELLEGNGSRTMNIPIKILVLPTNLREKEELQDEKVQELLMLAKEAGTKIMYMEQGDVLKENELTITCLHPSKEYGAENANDGSMVLSVTYKEFDLLLTGDVEGKGEAALIEYMKQQKEKGELLDYEVLKVAHHGSNSSTVEELLEIIKVEIGIISCGKDNRYGHPHQEVINRLERKNIEYYLTSVEGAITIQINSHKINRKNRDFYEIIRYNKSK